MAKAWTTRFKAKVHGGPWGPSAGAPRPWSLDDKNMQKDNKGGTLLLVAMHLLLVVMPLLLVAMHLLLVASVVTDEQRGLLQQIILLPFAAFSHLAEAHSISTASREQSQKLNFARGMCVPRLPRYTKWTCYHFTISFDEKGKNSQESPTKCVSKAR